MREADDDIGRQVARAAEARLDAIEALAKRNPPFRFWHYWLTLLFGVGWGLVVAQIEVPWLVSSVAGAGLFLAAAAFVQCVRLRRRLDAVVVLLRQTRG